MCRSVSGPEDEVPQAIRESAARSPAHESVDVPDIRLPRRSVHRLGSGIPTAGSCLDRPARNSPAQLDQFPQGCPATGADIGQYKPGRVADQSQDGVNGVIDVDVVAGSAEVAQFQRRLARSDLLAHGRNQKEVRSMRSVYIEGPRDDYMHSRLSIQPLTDELPSELRAAVDVEGRERRSRRLGKDDEARTVDGG